MPTTVTDGLRGVAVTETALCDIDGTAGKLIYRGYTIEDLAENSTFEEVAYLLWKGSLPTQTELEDINRQFIRERVVPDAVLQMANRFPKGANLMDALRTLVSYVAAFEEQVEDNSVEANMAKSLRLTAKMPTLVAALFRAQEGLPFVEPLDKLGLAANFLYMIKGAMPDPFVAKTLDTALILHADHGFNASTFAARVTCATLSDLHSGIVSAIGTLKGPLHGGANEAVMAMLMEVKDVSQAKDYVASVIEGKHTIPGMAPKRIAGFGHAVYKTMDPRAKVLRKLARTLGERAGDLRWMDLSEAIENAMEASGAFEKGIYPNVDFFSASAYYTMGFPLILNTPIFAISRTAGWTAHILEQHGNNKLIRPTATYVGERDLSYIPIEQR